MASPAPASGTGARGQSRTLSTLGSHLLTEAGTSTGKPPLGMVPAAAIPAGPPGPPVPRNASEGRPRARWAGLRPRTGNGKPVAF